MSDFSSQAEHGKSFGTIGAVITLFLVPPTCVLTLPAIYFAHKAKRLWREGSFEHSRAFSKKAKRYTSGAWAIAFIIALTLLALYTVSRLSLI